MAEVPARKSAAVRRAIGYAIAAAGLVWVFHDVEGKRLLREMRTIRWGWVAIAVALDIMSYAWQGLRWSFLLRPVARVPVPRATQVIYVGLLTNEVVPLRAGELVRAYIVSRRYGVPFLSVIPSVAIGRLFDGLWLAVWIALIAIFVQLPANLLRAADIFGIAALAVAALFVYLIAHGKSPGPEGREPAARGWHPVRRLSSFIGAIADSIRRIGRTRYFYLSFFASPLIIVCQIASFWFVMKAYGLPLSLWTGAAVFIIMYFGTALPNAPSNVGTYQFFTVLGLALFGVDKTTAAGFSVAVFVILTAALWIAGLLSLATTGISIGDIRRDIGEILRRK